MHHLWGCIFLSAGLLAPISIMSKTVVDLGSIFKVRRYTTPFNQHLICKYIDPNLRWSFMGLPTIVMADITFCVKKKLWSSASEKRPWSKHGHTLLTNINFSDSYPLGSDHGMPYRDFWTSANFGKLISGRSCRHALSSLNALWQHAWWRLWCPTQIPLQEWRIY